MVAIARHSGLGGGDAVLRSLSHDRSDNETARALGLIMPAYSIASRRFRRETIIPVLVAAPRHLNLSVTPIPKD